MRRKIFFSESGISRIDLLGLGDVALLFPPLTIVSIVSISPVALAFGWHPFPRLGPPASARVPEEIHARFHNK